MPCCDIMRQAGAPPPAGYDPTMRFLPNILLVLSLPAGIIGYTVTARLVSALVSGLALPGGIGDLVILFVPLLVAGLCMMPFIIPFIDRKAKQDLADYRASQASSSPDADGKGTK